MCKLADLICHNGEASAGITCSCSLNTCIKSKKTGLIGDLINQVSSDLNLLYRLVSQLCLLMHGFNIRSGLIININQSV